MHGLPTSLIPRFAPGLAPLDLAIVALYLVAITVFGLRFSRRAPTSHDGKPDRSLKSYFLADNTIPWWAIALSIVSAETSTLTIISIPGVAFGGDFGFLQIVLGYMLGRIVVAMLFLPRYFRGEMLTAYQLIDQRFGATLHKLTAGLFLLTRAAAEGVRVFAISIVVGIAIGTGDTLSIGIISLLTLLYTFEGGLAAVIWTDVVQMGLYLAGTLVALWTLGAHVSGGWSYIHLVGAHSAKFHMLDFSLSLSKSYTFWAGVLGGTFLTMASHGTDQLMVQRMLAARSLRESRLALLSSGAVILLQFTLFLLIGVGLFVFYGAHPQAFQSPDRIFPTFIVREMPHGVAGLLVAAILAAAMSNLSAALNSLASTSVVDFYMHWRPLAESRERTLISRSATVFWAVVLFAIAVYAVQHGGKGHVVETGLSIASVAYGCLLGVFLLGTLTRYATQVGAILGMICGLGVNLVLWQASLSLPFISMPALPHIAFTWYVLIGALVTFGVGTLFSFLLPRKRAIVAATVIALAFFSLLSSSGAQGTVTSAAGSTNAAEPPAPASKRMLQPHAQTTPNFTAVSALINAAIAAHKLPGAVVLIGHDHRIVFEHAYGSRALEPAVEAMTEDTLFDVASLTKVLVTTTAILQLYEAHQLELDAPVARYLPAFAANGKGTITVRQLLTHYSGLPEDINLKDSWGLAAPDKAEGLRRAFAAVPYGPAGVTFKYSDINFITLGALVEKLSGEDLDGYAVDHIFEPLRMTQTRYLALDAACGYEAVLGSAMALPQHIPSGNSEEVCHEDRYAWAPDEWISKTAPTAHDDEGTSATNPDFDHLLRGTVHDPTARRMGGVAGHAGVFSTARDLSRFCQALLDKLTEDTGPFPLKQSTLRLATSPNEPATAARSATIFTPGGQTTVGIASRGLGWDLNSPFSRPRGELFPITTREHAGSFGHTGFTGTSLWLDPTSNTYVILLANAIHPHVGPNISALRGQVATAAARALNLGDPASPPAAESSQATPPTFAGIDVLEDTHLAALQALVAAPKQSLQPLRIGLLTNQSGLDAQGRRTIDILLHADPEIQLTTLFSPEHGLYGRQDTEHLASEQDPLTHLPVISLYGSRPVDKRPKEADLASLDAVVIDLQDVGVRFWTYETLLGYFLEATACTHTSVLVLDRPNPLGGIAVEGPTSEPAVDAYTNYMPLPLRHGLTFGELALYFRAKHPCRTEPSAQAAPLSPGRLVVIPMQNWQRADFFDDTRLAWTPPSPNMRTLTTVLLYPAVGLIEQTNVSVGRGTPTPFEDLGAPYIRPAELAPYLTARHIPGVAFTPTLLTIAETPEHYPSHGQTIPGVHLQVTDRKLLDSPELGIELLAALHHLYPAEFRLERAHTLLANAATLDALRRNEDPRAIARSWQSALDAFRLETKPYRLYPESLRPEPSTH